MTSPQRLEEIRTRLDAAVAVAGTPWTGHLETRQPIGGDSFITFTGTDPNDDDELYLSFYLRGQPVRDERFDALVDFLAHAAHDIQTLLEAATDVP